MQTLTEIRRWSENRRKEREEVEKRKTLGDNVAVIHIVLWVLEAVLCNLGLQPRERRKLGKH